MVAMRSLRSQRGITLIELVLAAAIGTLLLASLSSTVKLGMDTQSTVRERNELAYQGNFALQTILNKARVTSPKELTTPASGTSGDWFAPTGCSGSACLMYCRNTSSQTLIETTTTDTGCTGSKIVARGVTQFSAQLPSGAGAVDRNAGNISITLSNNNTTLTVSTMVRLGGGTL